MTEFTALLQQGNAWFFIPGAILLGVLHGLEPGHSKTMMAAFIIAIKGTTRQAVMLGLAATLSHTAIVWLIAFGGMMISHKFTAESAEPWLQLISAVIILGTAGWMFWQTWRGERNWLAGMNTHEHSPHGDVKRIDTGHGAVELSVAGEGQLARWQFRTLSGRKWQAGDVSLVIPGQQSTFSQIYKFVDHGDYLESVYPVPESRRFSVRLSLGHHGHHHDYDLNYGDHDHDHDHDHNHNHDHDNGTLSAGIGRNLQEYQDTHELAHANDIKRRFTGQKVGNWQILLFGLTGGLIPCPAAITVLLICLQLKALALGATLVICFSIGLALTLVSVGVGAAISVRQVAKRWKGFNTIARRAPYFSSVLIAVTGIYMGIHGWSALAHQ
ncbi:nickel/cobalt efflux protein RcnA [Tatumella citrea]|uniref:Nickel/cobalt efflux system n=1 Tax=Tatumella citrea TaxID=53336 RepID=A0A1Y0LGX6_TATCI|nr:nickel/cobalt efflux protein RcnA [Tatumella citrea]ARU93324.1 nickel/cobalt efflux protein RcnA [Tatumella citrea]ARU97362.1 nickel/cobalt efflux protein RcnA [Tatumella citrea]